MPPIRPSSADRAGLFVLIAGLAVSLLVAFLAVRNQTEQRAAEQLEQGTRLVKALTAIPKDGLTPSPGRPNPLAAVLRAHGNADLAYGLVTDPQGRTLSEVAAPGLTPTLLPLPADKPAEWFGHRAADSGVAGLQLGEIPVQGAAFSHWDDGGASTETVVVITPRIVRDGDPIALRPAGRLDDSEPPLLRSASGLEESLERLRPRD